MHVCTVQKQPHSMRNAYGSRNARSDFKNMHLNNVVSDHKCAISHAKWPFGAINRNIELSARKSPIAHAHTREHQVVLEQYDSFQQRFGDESRSKISSSQGLCVPQVAVAIRHSLGKLTFE